MAEWKQCTISDLGTVVGGATPSTKDATNYENGTVSWITPKDLSDFKGRYIQRGERNITEKGLRSCSAQIMPADTVLFSSRAPIGYIAIAKNDLCTNQGFKSVIPNKSTDPLFLYYLLKYNKDAIEHMGSGTTFKEVSGNTMKNIVVRVPVEIQEQRRIAQILGSLDDKIEENDRINNNLMQQAKTIFEAEIVNRTELPNGWKKSNLASIADYLNGLAMQNFRPNDDDQGLPVLKIKELRQGSCDADSERCSSYIKSNYIVNDGDVIFSWSGSLLVDFWCGGICGLNQHLFKVTSTQYAPWFFYSWTNYHLAKFAAIASAKATTMGHIKRSDIEAAEVIIPSPADYERIGALIQPLYDLCVALRLEDRKLAATRDSLLPRLLSGDIDISEAII